MGGLDAQAVPIDLASWSRRQHFQHYRRNPCSFAITVELDVTPLVGAVRDLGLKMFFAQVWSLATVVNQQDEFRMCLTASGDPAVWPLTHPAFTVFNADRETFTVIWVPYDRDFVGFHDAAEDQVARYRNTDEMFPQGELPPDVFDVSSLPWASFTGFDLKVANSSEHLAPIFTLGRHFDRAGRTIMPVAIQINHAAADGFHTGRLINALQVLLSNPDWLARGQH